jgi:hypothetical protein
VLIKFRVHLGNLKKESIYMGIVATTVWPRILL